MRALSCQLARALKLKPSCKKRRHAQARCRGAEGSQHAAWAAGCERAALGPQAGLLRGGLLCAPWSSPPPSLLLALRALGALGRLQKERGGGGGGGEGFKAVCRDHQLDLCMHTPPSWRAENAATVTPTVPSVACTHPGVAVRQLLLVLVHSLLLLGVVILRRSWGVLAHS